MTRFLLAAVASAASTLLFADVVDPERAVALGIALGGASALWGRWRPMIGVSAACAAALLVLPSVAISPIGVVSGIVAAFHPLLKHKRTSAAAHLQSAALGMLASTGLLAIAAGLPLSPALLAALAGACTAVAFAAALPILWQRERQRPSELRVYLTVPPARRASVLRALALVRRGRNHTDDTLVRDGLDEVAAWVYRLERSLLRMQAEREQMCTPKPPVTPLPSDDAFTTARHAATLAHYSHLQDHAQTLDVEIERTDALATYALAWLEDAVAGLVVARAAPGLAAPVDMSGVLDRLRAHSNHRDALRRTELELANA